MKTTLLMLCLPLLIAFSDGEPDKDDPEFRKVFPRKDTTDEIIKSYTGGTKRAPDFLVVHADPKAGQYWELFSDSLDIETTVRRQVSRIDGDFALIERRMTTRAEMFQSDYVIAFRVNLKAEAGKPNIDRAWIGKPDEAPTLIKVRERKDTDALPAEAKKSVPFEGLELAGNIWRGELFISVDEEMTTQIWVAEGGYFDAIVKTTVDDDYLEQLRSYGGDADDLMLWPEKWQEAGAPQDPPKPD
ncbi:MAG: hypothetical protein K8I27_06680 [Planctomycetes bacterium]|nr:hypothetical protein [Planctomycetota bacterium]